MEKEFLINFANLFINALMILIFVRVILSWVPDGLGSFRKVIMDLTEPIMAPFRKLIPPMGGFDLTPIIIFILLQLLQGFIAGL